MTVANTAIAAVTLAAVAAATCAFAGCASSPPDDVVGPFTGDVHRYVVDRITLPIIHNGAPTIGADLDGDGTIDNQLASLVTVLDASHDITAHAADMIASGALASEVEIVADDLTADDSVAVVYRGAAGDQATEVGGRLRGDVFAPNLTRDTQVPGAAVLRLPIFVDADPVTVRAVGLAVTLTRDGRGGFDGTVVGGVVTEALIDAAYAGIAQMIAADPQDHIPLIAFVDTNHDAAISREEVAASPLTRLREQADLRLFEVGAYAPVAGGRDPDAMSFGLEIHLAPCPAGRCSAASPADACHDRIVDGDETDVDCGGSCRACAGGAVCQLPADCQTAACDGGRCRAASCSDGLLDGFELAVDCGGGICTGCARGQRCWAAQDCASGTCDFTTLTCT